MHIKHTLFSYSLSWAQCCRQHSMAANGSGALDCRRLSTVNCQLSAWWRWTGFSNSRRVSGIGRPIYGCMALICKHASVLQRTRTRWKWIVQHRGSRTNLPHIHPRVGGTSPGTARLPVHVVRASRIIPQTPKIPPPTHVGDTAVLTSRRLSRVRFVAERIRLLTLNRERASGGRSPVLGEGNTR